MYVLLMPNGRYVRKGDGINDFVRDVEDATKFYTKEAATAAKPGHHRDMGGSGFKGRVVTYTYEKRCQDNWRKQFSRYFH